MKIKRSSSPPKLGEKEEQCRRDGKENCGRARSNWETTRNIRLGGIRSERGSVEMAHSFQQTRNPLMLPRDARTFKRKVTDLELFHRASKTTQDSSHSAKSSFRLMKDNTNNKQDVRIFTHACSLISTSGCGIHSYC